MKKCNNKKLTVILILCCIFVSGLTGCKKEDSGGKAFKGTAVGYAGDISVEITMTESGKIGTLLLDASKENPDKGGAAATKVAKEIIKNQKLSVDAVSGATVTSDAVISATRSALEKAGVKADTFE